MALTAAIAISDAVLHAGPLGYLYVIPIVLVSGRLPLWGVPLLAASCLLLALKLGWHDPSTQSAGAAIIEGATFLVAGALASKIERTRERAEAQFAELQRQSAFRAEAEEQLTALIDTSLAGILTVDSQGTIILANQSAQHMFVRAEGQSLEGAHIDHYLPFVAASITNPSRDMLRTMVEGRALRSDQSAFYAQVWASNYKFSQGWRLALIVWDASEERREYEELGLRQLLNSSRILTGAVAHEVRNLAAAISMHSYQLSLEPGLKDNPHVRALAALVRSLQDFASAGLRAASGESFTEVNVNALIEDIALILEPVGEDGRTKPVWEIQPDLPPVRGERSALVQVLLNLINNAFRAAAECEGGRVVITAYVLEQRVLVGVANNGPAIRGTERLFEPFQTGATATGLGLYVSRAIVRTFGGNLRLATYNGWNRFLVELVPVHHVSRASNAGTPAT